MGKTTLLARFLQTVPGFYFLASEEGTARNVQDFSRYAGEYLDDPDFERSRYPDWEAVIKALASHRNFPPPPGQKVVIVIDEFPYLIARDRATPSGLSEGVGYGALQRAGDARHIRFISQHDGD